MSENIEIPEGHVLCPWCEGRRTCTEVDAIEADGRMVNPRKVACMVCGGAGHIEPEPEPEPEPPPTFYRVDDQVAWNMANIPDWATTKAAEDAQGLIEELKRMRAEFETYRTRHPDYGSDEGYPDW